MVLQNYLQFLVILNATANAVAASRRVHDCNFTRRGKIFCLVGRAPHCARLDCNIFPLPASCSHFSFFLL